MYRKNSKNPSGSQTANTLRDRLKQQTAFNTSPAQSRAPLSIIQPSALLTQSTKPSTAVFGTARQNGGFTFDSDPMDILMDISSPPQSQSRQNMPQSTQRMSTEIDPLFEQENATVQANEYNPQVEQRGRDFMRQTQAPTYVFRSHASGEDAEGYNNRPIFRKLKKLGVVVQTNQVGKETYFYMGELTHVKLMNLIEKYWDAAISPMVMKDLKEELANHPESWQLFLLPSKNINGIQDTIFRALILSKHFQNNIITFLLDELNKLAVNKPNEDQIKRGSDILLQLRFITQVFYPQYIFETVFDNKRLEKWHPTLRDGLIEILPELFTDSSVHSSATVKLIQLIKDGDLDERKSLHAACLNAIKCFEIDNTATQKRVYNVAIKNLMKFDTENIPLAVETVLSVTDKLKELSTFFYDLCQHFDFEKLNKEEERSESLTAVEECISKVFFLITELMRFNINRSEKELLKFYNYNMIRPKSATRSKKSQTRADVSFEYDDNDNNDSDDDDSEDEENPEDHDFIPDETKKPEDEPQRDFTLFDVMLLLCHNEASNDSSLVLRELRKQILLSHDNFLNMKEALFRDAVSYSTFAIAYFPSILMLARNLLQSPNPRLNQFGEVIYQNLFSNPRLDRATILRKLLAHLGEIDHETTSALSALNVIAQNHLEYLRREHLPVLNALINNLSLLSTQNIRKLFFVLVSVNFYPSVAQPTQIQRRRKNAGDKFIQRLRHYLTSNISGEIIWGVIGLVQYVKVLLLNTKDGDDNEAEIFEILQLINTSTRKSTGKIRAEFYIQLSELLKSMERLPFCDSLNKFGEGITNFVQKKFYPQAASQLPNGPGIYESEEYVDASVNNWINLADIVEKDDKSLSGDVCSLLPLLHLIKDFASYRQSFMNDSGDPLKTNYWSSFMFILESNINLNPITNAVDLTEEQQLHRCNVLYVTIEYLRTVMNMFAECKRNEERIEFLMSKKLNLMQLCHIQTSGCITNKLQHYVLPRISHINKDDLVVKSKKTGDKKKLKKKIVDREIEDDEDSRADSIFIDDESSDATGLENGMFRFKLRKTEGPKKITIEQLEWYCIPLRLETITRLLRLKQQKLRVNLFLVENFYVILKHTLPARGKVMSAGLLLGGSGPQLPIAITNLGSKEERWSHISDAIKPIFDQLSKAVEYFQNHSTQAFRSLENKETFSNVLKFCVMIFSRIFQSREIARECDHQDTDRTGNLMSRRSNVLSILNNAINIFDSSLDVQGNDTTRNDNSSVAAHNDTDASRSSVVLHGRINDPARISDLSENDPKETNVVNFFLKVATYVTSMECAAMMTGLFKTFTSMDVYHTQKCAEMALKYLSETWSHSDDEELENLDEKNAIRIATDYIYFRPDGQKLNAINWLIWHQLLSLYPNSILSGSGLEVGDFKGDDDIDYVQNYKDTTFPCFQKIPQWHKMLFKQFNDNILKLLKAKDYKESDILKRSFVEKWKNHIETFYALLFVLNNPGFRVQNVLLTIFREGKRFVSFIGSKQSSFALCIRNKKSMATHQNIILKSLQTLHGANKLLYDLQVYVKKKKIASLLKLIPELKAAQERMARGFYDAAVAGGFSDAVEFQFTKAKKLIDPEKTKTPKKEKSVPKKKQKDKSAPKKATGTARKRTNKKNTDEPPKKRGRKSKNAEASTIDDSIQMLANSALGVDSTRDNSGYVDDDDSVMDVDEE